MQLQGKVKQGAGEGKFFMSLEPYVQEMKNKLGYTPFPGTLNVSCKKEEAKQFVHSLKKIRIPGFTKGTKTFGFVDCYPCHLKEESCAIIVPEFTRYELDTVEIIAAPNLRSAQKLVDEDSVVITQ